MHRLAHVELEVGVGARHAPAAVQMVVMVFFFLPKSRPAGPGRLPAESAETCGVQVPILYLKHALEPDVEHGVPVVEQVDVEEAVGLPEGLLVDGLEVALRQQRRELFQQAVLLQLVPQAPDHEELAFTLTALLTRRSFWVLTQVEIRKCRPRTKSVSRAASPVLLVCKCGESAKSSTRIKIWYSCFILSCLLVSVILRWVTVFTQEGFGKVLSRRL